MRCPLMIQSISGFETVDNALEKINRISQEIVFKLVILAMFLFVIIR